jgi:glycosyltransferase involved in cell wall biosynthesis
VAVTALREQEEWGTRVTDDEERRVLDALPPVFVLGASRFIPYKRLDLVLEAAARLGIPAVVAGRGPEEARLRALAETLSIPVQIIISPSDALLYALMQRSAAFVFPAVEDFGIIPVEAQALGTPVVTGPIGGQLETFTPGVSGIIAASTDPADLASSLGAAIDLPPFDADAVTRRFDETTFISAIRDFVA